MSEHQDGGGELSRRELMGKVALLGLVASGGGLAASQALAQGTGVDPDKEVLRKVLIERLVNSRYYIAEDGSVVVLPHDEVWPGDSGGAYHADWLFNSVDGLKTEPNVALEQTVYTDIVHEGIPSGWDLSKIKRIIQSAEATGLLDDANLVYQVLREKIHVEMHGAHEYGVELFRGWIQDSPDYTAEQKSLIDRAATDYLSRPVVQTQHDFY